MKIREDKSKKCVGETSLFITFDYNPNIVNVIKEAGNGVWDKNTKTWEVPNNKLAFIIDRASLIEDIDIELLPDEKAEHIDISIPMKTKPYAYQLEGIDYMLNNPNCLLLDAPGLGKTLQVIYLAEELKARGEVKKCLIICGINSLKSNWEKEIKKHSYEDCVIIGKKVNSKGKIIYSSVKERAQQLYDNIDPFFTIINVECIRDKAVVEAIINSKNEFDLIIFDEVHKCLDYDSIIITDKGPLKIGYIVENNITCNVLSYNNGKLEYKPVINYFKKNTELLLELKVEEDNIIYTIKCTPDHKIYTSNRGWVEAQYLTEYDNIKIIKNNIFD